MKTAIPMLAAEIVAVAALGLHTGALAQQAPAAAVKAGPVPPTAADKPASREIVQAVSYTHLTLPTTPYV